MLWCEHVFVSGRLFYRYTGNFIVSVLIQTYIHTYIHTYMSSEAISLGKLSIIRAALQ